MSREDISAFADGEFANGKLPAALAGLATAEGLASWNLYHQIGDTLRSDELAGNVSAGFSARMAARLAAEPPLAGSLAAPRKIAADELAPVRFAHRLARPGAASRTPAGAPVFPVLRTGQLRNGARLSMQALVQLTLSVFAVGAALAAVAAAALFAAPQFSNGSLDRELVSLVVPLGAEPLTASSAAVTATASASPLVATANDKGMTLALDRHPLRDALARQMRRARYAPAGDGTVLGQADGRIADYLQAHQEFSPSLYQAAQYVRSVPFAADSGK